MELTRNALITGANTGIGRVTAIELSKQGYRLFLAGRSLQRTQAVMDEIRAITGQQDAVQFLPLQLDDLASVKACAQQFLDTGLDLHLLVNNAGLAGKRGITQQGFELAFGANHLGHFLLTLLLLDKLKSSAPARVVTVASRAHRMAFKGMPWDKLQQSSSSLSGVPEYAVSKLANILFSRQLAAVLSASGVSCYALHPGVVATEVWREVPRFLQPLLRWRGMLTPEQGAQTSLHCCLTAPATESGLYYDKCRPVSTSAAASNDEAARRLWDSSTQWVKDFL